jgi:pimeloyl-[acyl-carrier protein] methyl ester esterase
MKTKTFSVTRSGRGRPIILLHGWGMNAAVFEPLCAELVKTREVFNVDLPGYGKSYWDESMTFADQVAMMSTKLPPGELLGWSMGGLYAAEMVRQNPDRYDRLLLICCNPCFVRQPDWQCAVETEIFDAFNQDLRRGWRNTIKRFLTLQMHGSDNARQLIKSVMERLEVGGEPGPDVEIHFRRIKN